MTRRERRDEENKEGRKGVGERRRTKGMENEEEEQEQEQEEQEGRMIGRDRDN